MVAFFFVAVTFVVLRIAIPGWSGRPGRRRLRPSGRRQPDSPSASAPVHAGNAGRAGLALRVAHPGSPGGGLVLVLRLPKI